MVHLILREEGAPGTIRTELDSPISRLHVLVLGLGLGREPYIWMLGQDLSAIRGYRRAVLTPNVVEFKDGTTPLE